LFVPLPRLLLPVDRGHLSSSLVVESAWPINGAFADAARFSLESNVSRSFPLIGKAISTFFGFSLFLRDSSPRRPPEYLRGVSPQQIIKARAVAVSPCPLGWDPFLPPSPCSPIPLSDPLVIACFDSRHFPELSACFEAFSPPVKETSTSLSGYPSPPFGCSSPFFFLFRSSFRCSEKRILVQFFGG